MKKVIIIGTIHLGWTPGDELKAEIAKYNPDKLFIELTDSEVEGVSIRDEMFIALDWARENIVPYAFFDSDFGSLKDGITGKEPEFMAQELRVKEMLKEHNWKSLNNRGPWNDPEIKKAEDEIIAKYFDLEKKRRREEVMTQNIMSELVEGTNVVITGAGHITHFLADIPNAVAPFRTE